MLITREVDYAVRILRVLSEGRTVSVQEICRKENVSVSIAYKITRKLEKAGIIKSYRGMNGGYALSADLDKITLYDVIRVVDKELLITECLGHSYTCSQNTEKKPCSVHGEFCRLQSLLIRELKSRSLLTILS